MRKRDFGALREERAPAPLAAKRGTNLRKLNSYITECLVVRFSSSSKEKEQHLCGKVSEVKIK